MKRYLVFAGKDYYPNGGAEDFYNDYEMAADAKYAAAHLGGRNDGDLVWAHVFDSEARCVIARWGRGVQDDADYVARHRQTLERQLDPPSLTNAMLWLSII